jgi:hypothetical protein
MKYIYSGMKAYMNDGAVARVCGILFDPHTSERRGLVLAANGLFGPDVVVPFSAIWLIDDAVHLTLSCAEVATMPCFHRTPSGEPAAVPEATWRYVPRRRAVPSAHTEGPAR